MPTLALHHPYRTGVTTHELARTAENSRVVCSTMDRASWWKSVTLATTLYRRPNFLLHRRRRGADGKLDQLLVRPCLPPARRSVRDEQLDGDPI